MNYYENSLFIKFHSDSSIQSYGFVANTGTTSLGPASLSSGDVCGGYIVSKIYWKKFFVKVKHTFDHYHAKHAFLF